MSVSSERRTRSASVSCAGETKGDCESVEVMAVRIRVRVSLSVLMRGVG